MKFSLGKILVLVFTIVGLNHSAWAAESDAAEDQLMEKWSQIARTDAPAFLALLNQEAAIYAAMAADDVAATSERNVKTNILLGIAMNVKLSRLSREERITAVVNILSKAYRQKSFRGIEMIIADYKANRVSYDAKIEAIGDAQIRKLIRVDLNAYLQPQAD